MRYVALCVGLALALSLSAFSKIASAFPSISLPGGLPPIGIPGLDRLLKEDPPVTTSFADAVTEIPYLDDYNPKAEIPMGIMGRDGAGAYHLLPGAYSFEAQSYCLHAGTYAPGRGEGYLFAPLKGPKAGIVRNILQRSTQHPRIPQSDIQTLIWAIEARTKYDDLSPQIKGTGSQLLSADEIANLNGGTLGVIPDAVRARAFANVPQPVQQIYEAENRVRQLVTQASTPFSQIEQVAVLRGNPAPDGPDVPRVRWSYHPDGYFIRYSPSGYSHTHVEISVPGDFTVARDRQGRITAVSSTRGDRIDLAYDDAAAAVTVPNDFDTRAFAFQSIRFASSARSKILNQKAWNNVGWTFVGMPNGNGNPASPNARFAGIEARYQTARAQAQLFDGLMNKIARHGPSRDALRLLVDLANLRVAVAAALGRQANAPGWVSDEFDRLAEAWEATFSSEVGGHAKITQRPLLLAFVMSRSVGLGLTVADAGGSATYDPSGGVATPANTGRQRLGQSGRCSGAGAGGGGSGGPGGDLRQAISDALHRHGASVNAQDIALSGSGPFVKYYVRVGGDGKILPTLACIEEGIANGTVGEGSQAGAKTLLMGAMQQSGDQTRITIRTVDVETGEITGAGKGDAKGTNSGAIHQAANGAVDNLGASFH